MQKLSLTPCTHLRTRLTCGGVATANPPRKRREKRESPEGRALAVARERLGLSQSELAAYLGVNRSLIGQIEAGWCPLPRRIAEAVYALVLEEEATA